MSFICEPCHVEGMGTGGGDRHIARSYGRCEDCGKSEVCWDCRCSYIVKTPPVEENITLTLTRDDALSVAFALEQFARRLYLDEGMELKCIPPESTSYRISQALRKSLRGDG